MNIKNNFFISIFYLKNFVSITNHKRLLPEQLLKQLIKLNKDYLNLCEIASWAKKLTFPPVQSQIAPFREQSSLHNGGLEWLRLLVFACAKPVRLHTLIFFTEPAATLGLFPFAKSVVLAHMDTGFTTFTRRVRKNPLRTSHTIPDRIFSGSFDFISLAYFFCTFQNLYKILIITLLSNKTYKAV